MYNLNAINEYTYSLKINGDYHIILYKTIQKMIKTAHHNENTDTIIFTAEEVHPFKFKFKKLSLSICIKLIDDLSKQIFYLKKLGYSFYGFDINDILIIDDSFIFCSTNYLLPLEDEYIHFLCPFEKPYFSNPEIIKISKLPSKIHHKCCYYSVGIFIVFCLLNNYLLMANELKTTEEIEDILKPIYNTKIYWFIKRCLVEETNKRTLLLI